MNELAMSLPRFSGQEAIDVLPDVADLLFNEASQGLMLTDASARIVRVNKTFCRITGFASEEVIGKTPALFRSSQHPASFYEEMWQTISKQGCWQGEIWNRRRDHAIYRQWLKITEIKDQSGEVRFYLGMMQDLSEQPTRISHSFDFIHYDRLTGLGSREMLINRFPQALAQSKATRTKLLILWIDASQLGHINEQYGLTIGDLVVRVQGLRLKKIIDEQDTLVRLYADDFVLLHQSRDACADMLCETILDVLRQPISLGDKQISCCASIGVACFPHDSDKRETLLNAAEMAVQDAKRRGGNCVAYYNPSDGQASVRRHQILRRLSQALVDDDDALHLFFQPKWSMNSRHLTGIEALIRWRDVELGDISPAEFIPIAEQSDLIIKLDRWVVLQLCKLLPNMRGQSRELPMLSINLSARHLCQPDLCDWLLSCLSAHGVRPCELELEITETALMDNEDKASEILVELKRQGFHIALDDFGSGYSSLSHLKNMPLDTVKIDRSLIQDLTCNNKACSIVKNLTAMVADLSLNLVVEGVETIEQHELLRQLGCQQSQGYLYARPMPMQELLALLAYPAWHFSTKRE
ncbi:EAL domain-containing protein [Bowmanella sp. Y26]|uniref:putative bifunctional diguanylate cyclase/phosphodiesterase n=1 Tax=Bowmanella yangjiangensis TaxID=2811230 RepID=UPI001BDCE6CD|nr:bifunctional diguanylate cyclase/phosphodiesterase [Bowmanella yangjiangensis]MBT1065548.1 EAL domain-containing protein [Bowmanella yangjiangensis]